MSRWSQWIYCVQNAKIPKANGSIHCYYWWTPAEVYYHRLHHWYLCAWLKVCQCCNLLFFQWNVSNAHTHRIFTTVHAVVIHWWTPAEYCTISVSNQHFTEDVCLFDWKACEAHTYRTFIAIQFHSLVDTCRGNIPQMIQSLWMRFITAN